VSFFEPRPAGDEPDEHVEYRTPAWREAPDNMLPASAALDVVLAATPEVGVSICGARVYPEGITFGLQLVRRSKSGEEERYRPPLLFHGPFREGDPRFGVAFADGRRAELHDRPPHEDGPPAIRFAGGGGGGSDRRWEGRFWLWPLPPEGPLTFAFTWPAKGIEETLVEVDSAPLRAAATRALELWPDERPEPPKRPPGAPGWDAYR
jgi:hypothetical protein